MSNSPDTTSNTALYYDEPSTPSTPVASSAHLSPTVLPEAPDFSPGTGTITRTVAIIKNHALPHRLNIEPKILAAGFEIVKERPMEFDTEADPDTYYELFGEDAASLAEGAVWVYILERRRAVQVLQTLARSSSLQPSNALMASPDEETAEIQIASLFASSPPFPTSDLPVGGMLAPPRPAHSEFDPGSIRSISSSVLEALHDGAQLSSFLSTSTTNLSASTPSQASTNASLNNSTNANGKPMFKARPLPRTHTVPDITPRQTRAALLRAGIAKTGPRMSLGPPPKAKVADDTRPHVKSVFLNVPGHKRSGTITVASTAPPAIAPRLTKAAALRLGLEAATLPPGKRAVSDTTGKASIHAMVTRRKSAGCTPSEEATPDKKSIFEGVPGHKRRETISVASVRSGPTVTPRMNRSAALRVQKEEDGKAPPSSFMFRTPTEPKMPGHSRPNSAIPFNTFSRPASRTANQARPTSQAAARSSSQSSVRPPLGPRISSRPSVANGTLNNVSNVTSESEVPTTNGNGTTAAKKVRRLSSLQAPTIAPRPNKSAMLRAAKMNATIAGGLNMK